MRIHKQTVDLSEERLDVPGRIIYAAEQHGEVTVWYETGPKQSYQVVLTGEGVPLGKVHVSSFLIDEGDFVGHIYH